MRARIAARLRISEGDLPPVVLRKRSLDARRGRVRFHLSFEVGATETADLGAPHPREVGAPRVVVVGAGPAGLFAAYALARRGIGSVVLDRGKPVQPRRRDLKGLNQRGEVDPDSNYCFGEGGAGTYSDGKLYTRAHKRGDVRDVIEILVRHGAPRAILTDARPHIGSNQLPKVVTHLREELEAAGVQFRFGARVEALVVAPGSRRVTGVRLADGTAVEGETLILATGHSASDIVDVLVANEVRLEPKPFALGVRIEHPQPLINHSQYGSVAGHPALPAAAYRLAETIDGRGVFSFCMCPGGFIVPASTVPGGVVVNGMSLSRRDSPFANSGLVVAVEPEDVARLGFDGVRGGIELQRRLEAAAFERGGGLLMAPATRATDFVARRASTTLPKTSYIPGVTPSDLNDLFDSVAPGFAERLRRALGVFERRLRGYVGEDAVLVGVETRTSSPLRIPRDADTLQSPDLERLYPAGEGGGHAGGIMSAAMDGLRVGRAAATLFGTD
ncbi:MAG TPA: FAD-dependent monooxygenase [Polyangiaceae bacterium]|jgi:hypothetical protein|nr:FAD-dependent monooxygenase [Polyangiaceae bacterium]